MGTLPKRWALLLAVLAVLYCLVILFAQQRESNSTEQQVPNPTEPRQEGNLIIHLNVPEAEPAIDGDSLQLYALRLHPDGHFTRVSDGLVWKSSSNHVAIVDAKGNVQFLRQSGSASISVSDGQNEDTILLNYDEQKEPKISVVKQEGERYRIIDKAIAGMTLEEKVGQMMMPDFRLFNGKDVTQMSPEIAALVKKYHIGGVILFRENLVDTAQTIRLVSDFQRAAEKYGLLISIDQEGGIITRLPEGTDLPGNMALGATRSPDLARKAGSVIGRELAALGINTNFAPVLDVNNHPGNPVIGVRSFGEEPQLVADLGIAYLKGLQQNGIAATVKHFPGHGDTAVDSHLGLPEVPHDKDRLLKVELQPFKQAIANGVDAIMTAHVTFPKIDATKVISRKDGRHIFLPATLSPKAINGLIRDELGFDGVVSTDAMDMQAIADHFGPVEAAIRAVKAGADIVLMPIGLEEVVNGMLQAVRDGEISERRIDQSVRRILILKVKRAIFKLDTQVDLDDQLKLAKTVIGSAEHKQVEAEVAASSTTLVKNENVLPLQLEESKKIAIVGTTYIENLAEAVKRYHANIELIKVRNGALTNAQWQRVLKADAVIIGSYTFDAAGRHPDNPLMKVYDSIARRTDKPVIAVGLRNPYDIMAYPNVDAYLASYGYGDANVTAAVDTIFGRNNPSGKLPVTIPDGKGGILYEYGHGLEYGE